MTAPPLTFQDSAAIPNWANRYVGKLVQQKLVSGYADGMYRPQQTITRAESVKILGKWLEIPERSIE